MLDRIVMDVIRVSLVIPFVTNDVFPKPPLPHAPATVPATRVADLAFRPASANPFVGKSLLDARPSRRKIRVPLRQRPDRVQVIGEQDERIDLERRDDPARLERPAEQRAGPVVAKESRPPVGDEREEKGAAGAEGAVIVRHVQYKVPERVEPVEKWSAGVPAQGFRM